MEGAGKEEHSENPVDWGLNPKIDSPCHCLYGGVFLKNCSSIRYLFIMFEWGHDKSQFLVKTKLLYDIV